MVAQRQYEEDFGTRLNARAGGLSQVLAAASERLPVPPGTVRLGAADHPVAGAGGELLRLASGFYVIRQGEILRSVPQTWARGLEEFDRAFFQMFGYEEPFFEGEL